MNDSSNVMMRIAAALYSVSTAYYGLTRYYHVTPLLWALGSLVLYMMILNFMDRMKEIRKK